jgi:hypothetical protein
MINDNWLCSQGLLYKSIFSTKIALGNVIVFLTFFGSVALWVCSFYFLMMLLHCHCKPTLTTPWKCFQLVINKSYCDYAKYLAQGIQKNDWWIQQTQNLKLSNLQFQNSYISHMIDSLYIFALVWLR